MPDVIRFSVGLPHVALRRNSETRAIGYRSKLKRQWQEDVWCAGSVMYDAQMRLRVNGQMTTQLPREVRAIIRSWPWGEASVHYVWYSTHETDADNIIATCKPLLDVLKATGPRPLGILADDGPGITVTAEWHKVAHRKDERVLVHIERIEA